MERGTVGNIVLGEFLAYNFINLKSFENHLLGYFFKEQVFSITPKSHPQTKLLHAPPYVKFSPPLSPLNNWKMLGPPQNVGSFKRDLLYWLREDTM